MIFVITWFWIFRTEPDWMLIMMLLIMNRFNLGRMDFCWWRMLETKWGSYIVGMSSLSVLQSQTTQESLLLRGLETAEIQILRSKFWSTNINDLKFRKFEKISRLRYFRRHVNKEFFIYKNKNWDLFVFLNLNLTKIQFYFTISQCF